MDLYLRFWFWGRFTAFPLFGGRRLGVEGVSAREENTRGVGIVAADDPAAGAAGIQQQCPDVAPGLFLRVEAEEILACFNAYKIVCSCFADHFL